MTPEADQPAAPRLDNLAAFLPVFDTPDLVFATMEGGREDESGANTMPWSRLSEHAARFVDTAYEDGWVSPEVDWARMDRDRGGSSPARRPDSH